MSNKARYTTMHVTTGEQVTCDCATVGEALHGAADFLMAQGADAENFDVMIEEFDGFRSWIDLAGWVRGFDPKSVTMLRSRADDCQQAEVEG